MKVSSITCGVHSLQCCGSVGVCPDTMQSDIVNITGKVSNGQTCVLYSRVLTTSKFVCVCLCGVVLYCTSFTILSCQYTCVSQNACGYSNRIRISRWENTLIKLSLMSKHFNFSIYFVEQLASFSL